MKASIIDLRYRMKDVLLALERNEAVEILYHGKVKGTIQPPRGDGQLRVEDHPFFGMRLGGPGAGGEMDRLRGGRYRVTFERAYSSAETPSPS